MRRGGGTHAELSLVAIKDTDNFREVCSGMFGGDKAFIEGEWNSVRRTDSSRVRVARERASSTRDVRVA